MAAMALSAALTLSAATPAALTVDALVVGVRPKGGRRRGISAPACLTAAARRRLEEVASALGATGEPGDVVRLPSTGIAKAPVVVAVGLGAGRGDVEKLRRAAGAAVRSLAGTRRVGFVIDEPSAATVEAIGLGALLGAYAFHEFRGVSASTQATPVRAITLLADPRDPDFKDALTRARAIADSVCLARDLVNTPPSALPPAALADAAVAAVADLDVTVDIWTEKQLAKEGFGGILAVGQGSANPPRLVAMRYAPQNSMASIALVGKGITFDSGGLSLKPPKAMETMKCDMGGAAAVIGAVQAIARLGLPVTVTGWIPTAENMPSGHAQRPGDVITMYGGRTVEVLNTDAEGRLVLADAIVRAGEEKPDVIIDAATLTGAAVVALGDRTAGIMSNDDQMRVDVWNASVAAGESMWHLPIPEESRASLNSSIADIKNIGDGKGGMLSAAAFLRDFVPEGTRWAHLDIAGPAFNDGGPYGYTPKGGTGAGVRTFIQIAIATTEYMQAP